METLVLVFYLLHLVATIIVILLNTHSSAKALAYLLLVILFPVIGSIIYFAFGRNLRHQKSNAKAYAIQLVADEEIGKLMKQYGQLTSDETAANELPASFHMLQDFVHHLLNDTPQTADATLLINGEMKFPEVLRMLATAKSTIHIEYYAWENDVRGNEIKELLLQKHREGVKVRALFDDYASRKIKHNIVRELREAGVAIYPKLKVKLKAFANRINHRDHRKLIIIDGSIAFVGGINLSDRYDNSIDTGLYWRDTHVKLEGRLVWNLQRHFIVSWNASQPEQVPCDEKTFPPIDIAENRSVIGQVVAGGPIYPLSNIMLTYARVFSLSTKSLWITNPYFIPNDTILDTLKQAAISGADVRLLMPKHSDSAIVGAASKFYFSELLEAGVRIFLYKKGFVHAKTVVSDGAISIVGTANMDIRSFDLNFEIMSVLYSREFALQMETMFENDLNDSEEVLYKAWQSKSIWSRLWWSVARLISELL